MLNNLRIRVALHKSSVDPLGALDTLSCGDDKLARLSLIECSRQSLLSVDNYIAWLCDVLLDLLADILTGLKTRILHGENDLVGILLSKSTHVFTAFLVTQPNTTVIDFGFMVFLTISYSLYMLI